MKWPTDKPFGSHKKLAEYLKANHPQLKPVEGVSLHQRGIVNVCTGDKCLVRALTCLTPAEVVGQVAPSVELTRTQLWDHYHHLNASQHNKRVQLNRHVAAEEWDSVRELAADLHNMQRRARETARVLNEGPEEDSE